MKNKFRLAFCLGIACIAMLAHSREQREVVLNILYDNQHCDDTLKTDWGFSCLIHGMEKNILFDTGADGEILSENFNRFAYSFFSIEKVVISHLHGDHTGGLDAVIAGAKSRSYDIYLPEELPREKTDLWKQHSFSVTKESTKICKNVYTTGVMGGSVKEQGLILDTEQGLILIVGCSHPGVVELVKQSMKLLPGKPVYMVVGGFHLLRENEKAVREIAEQLRQLGVEKIAPTHCTGEQAKQIFKNVFAENYIEAGVGWVYRIPQTCPKVKGPYLGQDPPGDEAVVFASGLISTQHLEHSAPTFSKDGREVYWSRWLRPKRGEPQVIMTMKADAEGYWSQPEIASFSGVYKDGSPILIDGDQTLAFGSKRSLTGESGDEDTWHLFRVERTEEGWSVPEIISPENTTETDFFSSPSVAESGNMYLDFNDEICVSKYEDGVSRRPEPLGSGINSDELDWTPFIAPDESYLIFSSHQPDNFGMGDLYISFKEADGNWSAPINMGDSVNTWSQERFPGVSPDGKYLFFTRWSTEFDHDVYWISTEVIRNLKSKYDPNNKSK